MAISATIALSSSTSLSTQKVTATITVTNSGAADVLVSAVAPKAVPSGLTTQSIALSLGVCPIGGAFNSTVAASSTLKLSFPVVAHAPITPSPGTLTNPTSQAYSIGALIYTSDGSITDATPSTLTVTEPI